MSKEVFITTVTSYFPNSPIDNNSMEDYLGLISGVHSRVKNIVLRQNKTTFLCRQHKAGNDAYECGTGTTVDTETFDRSFITSARIRTFSMCNCQPGPSAAFTCLHGTWFAKKCSYGNIFSIRHLFVMRSSIQDCISKHFSG